MTGLIRKLKVDERERRKRAMERAMLAVSMQDHIRNDEIGARTILST